MAIAFYRRTKSLQEPSHDDHPASDASASRNRSRDRLLATSLPAFAQNVSVQDLAVPGPLGDVALGPADAKVTIVEYASLTCSHCANFHKTT